MTRLLQTACCAVNFVQKSENDLSYSLLGLIPTGNRNVTQSAPLNSYASDYVLNAFGISGVPRILSWERLIIGGSAHSPSFQSLHLYHSSFWFSKLSVTSPTSQLILQPFPRFTYVTAHSPTLLSPLLRHRIFTYVTWRASQDKILGAPLIPKAFNT